MLHRYSFLNDYAEGAHPRILELLGTTNMSQENGYGNDTLSQTAQAMIQQSIQNEHASIHFVTGGTQANLIVLGSVLKPYESVIAVHSAHINIHEAGAIEATGHKIHSIESFDGKLTTEKIRPILEQHCDEHMVQPKVVFISHSTELGTIYQHNELENLSRFCRQNNLYLYLDGARLGSALASQESDVNLSQIAKLVDAFYIGGTKNGALLGEAIVLIHPQIKENFRYHLKQRGALLAKSRVLASQFVALFQNNLYLELANHANKMAEKLSTAIAQKGFSFLTHSTTNQIFPIFPNTIIEYLKERYDFYLWTKTSATHSAIRLVTSWATPLEAIQQFIEDISHLQY